MTNFISLSRRSDSFDGYVCELRGLGYGVEAVQLDCAKAAATIAVYTSSNISIARFDVGNRSHHLLECPGGGRTLGILTGDQMPTHIRGRPLGPDGLFQADMETGIDAVNEAGFSVYLISVSERRLEECAQNCQLPDGGKLLLGAGTVRSTPPGLLMQIRQSCQRVLGCSDRICEGDEVTNCIDNELPALLLQAWAGRDWVGEHCTAVRTTRHRALQRAVDCIRSSDRAVHTVEQLCRESAASYSTLERAFRDHFGMSPKKYLIHSRLAGVRRDLIGCRGERTVTEVASDWGFSHMGKFATDYRRLFGELPSETLRAA